MMPTIFKLIFFFVLIFSCSKQMQVTENGSSTVLKTSNLGINDVRRVPWKVGPNRRQRVDRGVQIEVDLPTISPEALELLHRKHGIDSWYVEIVRRGMEGEKTLQVYSLPLLSTGSKGKLSGRQISRFIIHVHYAASALSMRFARATCPQINHRLIVDQANVIGSKTSSQTLVASDINAKPINKEVEKVKLTPQKVNGGNSLMGEYLIFLGMMDSKTSRLMTGVIQSGESVDIRREKTNPISGCENYTLPDQPTDRSLKGFRFGN